MEDGARTTTKDEVMSTTAPGNVNIDTKDYFRKRIISKFEGTCLWSVRYSVIYLIGMIFMMHRNWVCVIIISIPVSLVFELIFRLVKQTTWEKLKSFLMISSTPGSTSTTRTSMKEVFHCFSHLFPISALFIFIHFFIVLVISPPQVLEEVGPYAFLYFLAFVFVFPVLAFWNDFKMRDYLIAFERRVQQTSSVAADHRRATYCKCTMPPNASASDTEWIRYYLVAN